MANINVTAKWVDGIYLIEEQDPVQGGNDGVDNVPHKQMVQCLLYLKQVVDGMQGTVDSYSPDMQEAMFAALKGALDLAALAHKEHDQTRLTRFQEITATIKNRGIKSGVTLTKSSTATRNISCSDGVVFMNGRSYPVANQENTAAVASNTGTSSGIVILYMFLTSAGVIDVAATTLNGAMPDGAIELARITVPGGNTEETDPYLENVVITESARREPGWPSIQKAPAQVSVALSRTLPDTEYQVTTEVISSKGGEYQLGNLTAKDKLKNGFKMMMSGTADDVKVRLLVQHPSM